MRAKLTKGDGTNLDPNEQVSPVNNWLHSLFSQVVDTEIPPVTWKQSTIRMKRYGVGKRTLHRVGSSNCWDNSTWTVCSSTALASSIPVRMPDSQSREPGFKSHCGRFKTLASLITPRCRNPLSCINEYLAIQRV